ncbi:unnamed protein product [Rhizophagus irregularis]|nr:unnamed protein product [Rhizophagus irregularis]
MCHSSLESSHNDEPNGGKTIFPRSLDAKILSEMSKIGLLYFYNTASFDISFNISASSDDFTTIRLDVMRQFQRAIAHLSTIIGCQNIK